MRFSKTIWLLYHPNWRTNKPEVISAAEAEQYKNKTSQGWIVEGPYILNKPKRKTGERNAN